ncbi:type II secretion system protein GspL [Glaciimonas sp. PCH181]|uniref:type II secretion system protein GspL n=1 Tax=Glaciimonas sp. PCH181 TaxID=2133943 RepID=UPI000D333B9B|nr:type II secretion system protein GspL [Glaciimonas sp. PCH181]PUA20203.1 general secretion pathway protein GspL [Glaciimonas sp. PCH181]
MSTLFIRLPARATLNSCHPIDAFHAVAGPSLPDCSYALISRQSSIIRSGNKQLSGLAEEISASTRVVLILAAVDVTLLQMPVPPMSDAKLKMALPHLIEEQLLVDPGDCIIVAARKKKNAAPNANITATDNRRLIGVVQRDWLTLLVQTVQALGGHQLHTVPAQLCLPIDDVGAAIAAVSDRGDVNEITLRIAADDGCGWLASSVPGQPIAQEVVDGLTAILPQRAITLYVPASSVSAYQESAAGQVSVREDDWSLWITGAQKLISDGGLDLMQGLNTQAATTAVSWRRWRWPIVLATLLLLINIISLNVEWWQMQYEARGIRAGMLQSYRIANPSATVIIDPIAQMQQKISAARSDNGHVASDDFVALAANLADALATAPQNPAHGTIDSLEYRDQQLLVHFKTSADADAAEAGLQKVRDTKQFRLSKPSAAALQIGINP